MMAYLRKRLGEKSTWIGLSAAFVSAAGAVSNIAGVAPWITNSIAIGIAFSGFVAAVLPSSKAGDL